MKYYNAIMAFPGIAASKRNICLILFLLFYKETSHAEVLLHQEL